MASGLPVLAFDYAAAAQLIRNGENGVLAPMDDAAAFVRAATHLAGQPALRRQMGAAAALTASELDWSTIVARFEGVLDTVMLRAAQPVSLSPGLVSKTKRPAV